MKKHKYVRQRRKPLVQAPNQAVASSRTKGARLSWIVGLAGVGVALVIGYLVFQKHGPSAGSDAQIAGLTYNTTPMLAKKPATNFDEIPGGTSRPGAVINREGEGRADDLNNQGTKFLAASDYNHAVRSFKQAIKLKPDDEDLHFNLALVLAKIGDLTNAELEYKEALRLLPDYPEAHHSYGNLLVRLGRMEEAEAQFKEAITEMPESAANHNSLGVLFRRLHKTNEALQCFQKAVQCDANYAEGHYNLAMSYLDGKEPERAVVELREALRIKPDFEPAQRALMRATSKP
jgi:tetratricopeptide (TPR) repeat protein